MCSFVNYTFYTYLSYLGTTGKLPVSKLKKYLQLWLGNLIVNYSSGVEKNRSEAALTSAQNIVLCLASTSL